MSAPTIKFDDGAVYERMMGKWSGLTGRAFIDWLSPPPNLRWVDIGCGNGAFTQLLVEHCAPMAVEGVDPRNVSWPLHESGWRHLSRSFDRAMQWHCHLPMAPSMRP